MKKLKDLNLNVIEDKSALTIKAGDCCGTETEETSQIGILIFSHGDWRDEGCC